MYRIKDLSNNRGGSRTETLVKLVLIFVISLLSFSVGTFVGKQFSDSQYRMTNLEKEYEGDTRKTASVEEKVTDEGGALTDEDIANLTREFIEAEKETIATDGDATADKAMDVAKKEEKVEAKPEPKKEMIAAKPETKKDAVMNAAQRVAKDMVATLPPKKTPAKKRVPSSLPKMAASDTIGKYTVQVASYATETDAKKHAQKLLNEGFSSFYVPAAIKGKTWFRVSVGLFETRSGATKYKKTLMSQAKLKSAIVRKIVK